MTRDRRSLLTFITGLLIVSFLWEGAILLLGGITGPYFVLLAVILMYFPALGALVYLRQRGLAWRRLVTTAGKRWYLLAAVVAPVLVSVATLTLAAATGLIAQALVDPATGLVNTPVPGVQLPVGIFILQFLVSLVLGVAITSLATFGEEFGWRGVFQNLFIREFGVVQGILLLGLIWGIWHAPLIYSGYNFPGYPLLGAFVLMPLLTIGFSGVFAWLTLRSGSLWPAVLAHASINSTAAGLLYWPQFEGELLTKYLLLVIPWFVLGILAILDLKRSEGTGAWKCFWPEERTVSG